MANKDTQWGDDDPRVKRDTSAAERRAKKAGDAATGATTRGMVGSYCDRCGAKDGSHERGCGRLN
jgi:hypothetical protein